MKSQLPPTGTEDFLELLSPFVPDDYLDQCWPRLQTGGRRYGFSASQLWRLHLLALITPVHSFNLLVRMLPEQKAWRRFARIPSQDHVPDALMVNDPLCATWIVPVPPESAATVPAAIRATDTASAADPARNTNPAFM